MSQALLPLAILCIPYDFPLLRGYRSTHPLEVECRIGQFPSSLEIPRSAEECLCTSSIERRRLLEAQ